MAATAVFVLSLVLSAYGFLLDNAPSSSQSDLFNSQYTGNGESEYLAAISKSESFRLFFLITLNVDAITFESKLTVKVCHFYLLSPRLWSALLLAFKKNPCLNRRFLWHYMSKKLRKNVWSSLSVYKIEIGRKCNIYSCIC